MKVLKGSITGMFLFFIIITQAQVSVSVHINAPPPWGPVGFSQVNYYYLPDVEAYYDIHSSMFIYYTGGAWVHRAYLPLPYKNYDLYGGYKVVMTDYHGNTPYTHFKDHKMKYAKGYHGHPQKTIGERPGKGNPGGSPPHQGKHETHGSGGDKDQGGQHGNGKDKKEDHGHGEGNGKKK